MATLNWGILGTAKIAQEKVIPPMQAADHCQVAAIASRNADTARAVAEHLGIPRSHGSYEALLADPAVDAVYIPLPNHLHVDWTIKAAEAGKHVLCEKPIGVDTKDAQRLLAVRERTGVYIQEAVMVRTHPQWLEVRELVGNGAIGRVQAVHGMFSYHKTDPQNIRNVAGYGGGGMLDIGCYPITTSRFVLGMEPRQVAALIEHDPELGIDRLGSALLDFPGVQATFTYGTQLAPHQCMQFFGDAGWIDVEIPFNAPVDRPCRLALTNGDGRRVIDIESCDQYGVQAERFARAVLAGQPQPVPLEDSLANMRVVDAAFRAGRTGHWERP